MTHELHVDFAGADRSGSLRPLYVDHGIRRSVWSQIKLGNVCVASAFKPHVVVLCALLRRATNTYCGDGQQ